MRVFIASTPAATQRRFNLHEELAKLGSAATTADLNCETLLMDVLEEVNLVFIYASPSSYDFGSLAIPGKKEASWIPECNG